jgi:hypothetical protein
MNTLKTNPAYFCYDSVIGVEDFAVPTAVFISGRANCRNDAFQIARQRGAEVYRYILPVSRPDVRVSSIDEELYMGDSSKVPLWPYLDGAGQQRVIYPGSKMVDIRSGSPLVDYMINYLEREARSGLYDGFYLDSLGAQAWGKSDFRNWPTAEKSEWTAGCIDFVRRLRAAVGPNFIIMNNNTWERNRTGEEFVNGICIEHPTLTNTGFLQGYAGHAYGDGSRRRVMVIVRNQGEADIWLNTQGVTHVAVTNVGYAAAQPTNIQHNDLRQLDLQAEVKRLQAEVQKLALEVLAAQTQAQENWEVAVELRAMVQDREKRITTLEDRITKAEAALKGE